MEYRDLDDYITRRARAFDLNSTTLSLELGYGRSYINSVINRQFQPSQKRCREIAQFFGDDPNIILALAGYYEPVMNDEPHLKDIERAARSLPPATRRDLLNYAHFLKERTARYGVTSGPPAEEEETEELPDEPPD